MPVVDRSRGDVVVVTGSSGFIGRAVIERLARGFRVVGFDREGGPHPPPEAECVCVDVTSDESVEAGLARVRHGYGDRIASVIHLAAYYDFSGEPSPLYEKITVRGTERLIRSLRTFALTPFVLAGATSAGRWNAVVAGLLLAALSLPRGRVRERYGAWDRLVV